MRRFFFFVLLCSSGLLFQSDLLHAQSNADCFACHSDKSLSQDKHGTHRSLFVDEQIFKKSVHASLDCTSCHEGFTPENIPHRKNIRPVNCTACHDEAVAKHPFHPQLAQAIASHQEPDVSCKDCHGMHDVASPKTPGSKFSAGNIGKACGECHSDVVEKFAASAHGKALSEKEPGA